MYFQSDLECLNPIDCPLYIGHWIKYHRLQTEKELPYQENSDGKLYVGDFAHSYSQIAEAAEAIFSVIYLQFLCHFECMLHEAGYSHLTNWPMGLKLKEDSTGGQEFFCCHGDKPYEQKDKFQNYILKYTATAYV